MQNLGTDKDSKFLGLQAEEPQVEKSAENQGYVKPILIGVTGGTASGKTSFCRRLGEKLKEDICVISLDSFYKGLS